MPTSPPGDLQQRLPAPAPGTVLMPQISSDQVKPERVLPLLWFITAGVDQPASVTLSPLLCLTPPVTKATVELLTEQSSHYQRHATCIRLQHSSTKHYLTPQTPLKPKQMSCLLGRTLQQNHPVKVLHRDALARRAGGCCHRSILRAAVHSAAPHACSSVPHAGGCAPCAHAQGKPMAHVLHAATGISPELGAPKRHSLY